MIIDPGSFRDPRGRVFTHEGRVFRALSSEGWAAWRQFQGSALFDRLSQSGRVIETREAAGIPLPPGEWAGVLEHAPVPCLSYPYEWPFGALRDAALFFLELLSETLREGFGLRDATPYNIQFRGIRPVHIDLPSFERRGPDGGWNGYGDFCRSFLYPLLLEAHKGIPFQRWVRGTLEGFSPLEMARLFGWRDWAKAGVFKDVVLQAALGPWGERLDPRAFQNDLRRALPLASVLKNIDRLQKIVAGLRSGAPAGPWRNYRRTNPYSEADRRERTRFVDNALSPRRRCVWDLGSNDGEFAIRAARSAGNVLALDADSTAVEDLRRRLAREGVGNVLPLVVDLADPSPAQGWRGRERRRLEDRSSPDLVLCLALTHHLVISRNIPLREWVEWLGSLRAPLVVEFATREDARVRELLAQKPGDDRPDYDLPNFRNCLGEYFEVRAEQTLGSGTRALFFAEPRAR